MISLLYLNSGEKKKRKKKRVKDKHAVDRTTSNLPRKNSG